MTPAVAIILQDQQALDRVGDALVERGLRPILWHGSGGAHAFIARRRPDLVVLSAPLETREAAIRLIQELCWDPETLGIPVIVESVPQGSRRGEETSVMAECFAVESLNVDDLLQLIESVLDGFHASLPESDGEVALST